MNVKPAPPSVRLDEFREPRDVEAVSATLAGPPQRYDARPDSSSSPRTFSRNPSHGRPSRGTFFQ